MEQIGVVGYDFSTIHSQYDFDIGQIDHWCIDVSTSILAYTMSCYIQSSLRVIDSDSDVY